MAPMYNSYQLRLNQQVEHDTYSAFDSDPMKLMVLSE